jgi:hypothetical protein
MNLNTRSCGVEAIRGAVNLPKAGPIVECLGINLAALLIGLIGTPRGATDLKGSRP